MSLWLRLDTTPPVALYRDRAALAHIDCAIAYPALISLGTLRRPLSRPNFEPAQTANMSATCDNADGAMTAEFALPPLRTPARIFDGATTIFTGLITAIDLGTTAKIDIESGLRQPLSDTVPLRSSTVWGSYDDARALPIVYGRATLAPVQYSQDRRLWLVADHPIQGVDQVTRDLVATRAWAHTNTLDSTGHPVALIELAEPLADGEALAVTLRGRMHPTTGALLTRADEILWDVLGAVCGLALAESDLDAYRADAAGIELAGVLADPTRTVRAQVDQILGSAGAAWSAGMPGLALAWPSTSDPDAAVDLIADRLTAADLTPSASEANLVTVLRVLYDYDWALGKHRAALQLEAPEAVERYGRIERELDAGWLHTARHADALGRAHLDWAARPIWTLTWTGAPSTDIPPGAWVEIDHPLSPIIGRHRLTRADLDMDRGTLSLAVDAPAGPAPVISATRLSSAFAPLIHAGAAVVYRDGVATFTIRDDAGQPLAGATVTYDATARRISDSAGRVSFPSSRGAHELLVEAEGYQVMTIEVML